MRKLFAALCLACGLWGQTGIQLTDPQLGRFTGDKGFAQDAANFEFAAAAVNRLKPRFVIVTGDLVNKPGDAAQIAEYKRIEATIDKSIPLYRLPGNHDLTDPVTAASLAAYRRDFGPDYFDFRQGDTAFFALNSCLMRSAAALPEEAAKMEAWFSAALTRASGEGAKEFIVFMHHPLFVLTALEPDLSGNVPLPVRTRYLKLMRDFRVRAVLCGHVHTNTSVRDGDLEVACSSSVGKPLNGAKSGLTVITYEPAPAKFRFFDFGDLP